MASSSSSSMSLDDSEMPSSGIDVSFTTPGGAKYSISRACFNQCGFFRALDPLETNNKSSYDFSTELNTNVLAGLDEKFYNIVFRYLQQFQIDKFVVAEIPEKCTMFLPSVVAPPNYWPLVENLTLQEIGIMDKISLYFAIPGLTELNELRAAFWLKDNLSKVDKADGVPREEFDGIIRPMVERDVRIEQAKRLKEDRLEVEAAAAKVAAVAAKAAGASSSSSS